MFGWLKKSVPSWPEQPEGMLFDAVEFCVFDCEMTGLDPKKHEIIAIGAVKIRQGNIQLAERFYQLIRPEKLEMSCENVLLHRLRHQDLDQGVPAAMALNAFYTFCGSAIPVGHFVGLDLTFLKASEKLAGGGPGLGFGLDTGRLAQWARQYEDRNRPMTGADNLQLLQLCRDHGIPLHQPHHAFYDALATACLFRRQWDLLHQAGYFTFADLFQLASVSA